MRSFFPDITTCKCLAQHYCTSAMFSLYPYWMEQVCSINNNKDNGLKWTALRQKWKNINFNNRTIICFLSNRCFIYYTADAILQLLCFWCGIVSFATIISFVTFKLSIIPPFENHIVKKIIILSLDVVVKGSMIRQ